MDARYFEYLEYIYICHKNIHFENEVSIDVCDGSFHQIVCEKFGLYTTCIVFYKREKAREQ